MLGIIFADLTRHTVNSISDNTVETQKRNKKNAKEMGAVGANNLRMLPSYSLEKGKHRKTHNLTL